MLIWRVRDVEMDLNPLLHLLPNQNCKNLRNDTRAPYTYSANMVLRARWRARAQISLRFAAPQAVAPVNVAPRCISAGRSLKRTVWLENEKRVGSQSHVPKAPDIRLRESLLFPSPTVLPTPLWVRSH